MMKMQWSATGLGTLPSVRIVMTNLQMPVLGQAEYTWLIFNPSGRLQCRPSTRCRTATRMKAPWLTTKTCARTFSSPSLASPATVGRETSGNSGVALELVLGLCSVSIRWNMDLRNSRKRVFTCTHMCTGIQYCYLQTSWLQLSMTMCLQYYNQTDHFNQVLLMTMDSCHHQGSNSSTVDEDTAIHGHEL